MTSRNPLLAEDRFETWKKEEDERKGKHKGSRNPLLAEDRFETGSTVVRMVGVHQGVAIPY